MGISLIGFGNTETSSGSKISGLTALPPSASEIRLPNGSTDAHWANVRSLIQFDDALTDLKGNVLTAVSGAVIDTDPVKFGSHSLDASESKYVIMSSALDPFFVNNEEDFTYELHFYTPLNGAARAKQDMINIWTGYANNITHAFRLENNTIRYSARQVASSDSVISITSVTNYSVNTWHHVAVSRQGSIVRLFLDGILEATGSFGGLLSDFSNDITIGRHPTLTDRNFGGNIDDLRFTRGVARYTSNFAVPTVAFPTS